MKPKGKEKFESGKKILLNTIKDQNNLLLKSFKSYCVRMETQSVPIPIIKQYMKIVEDSMKSGLEL